MMGFKLIHVSKRGPRKFTTIPSAILEKMTFKQILVTDGCDISSEIALRWTSRDLSDDKSTLIQVMAWCRQATSHFLNQCWPRSLPSYGVTRPQRVNIRSHWVWKKGDMGLRLFWSLWTLIGISKALRPGSQSNFRMTRWRKQYTPNASAIFNTRYYA